MAPLRSVVVACCVFPVISSAFAADYSLPYMPTKAAEWEWGSVFSGVDLASHGWAYGWAGAAFSPYGKMDTSGFRVYINLEGGVYQYPGDIFATGQPVTVKGSEIGGSLLAGYAFIRSNVELNSYIGVNVQNQHINTFDPENPAQGTRAGVEWLNEVTYNPTKSTLLYAWGSYSTVFQTYYTTLKAGYDISNGHEIFIGPMVTFLGNERFDQWRAGVHITSLRLGKATVELSGGFVHDSDNGNGGFGLVEINIPLSGH